MFTLVNFVMQILPQFLKSLKKKKAVEEKPIGENANIQRNR